MATSGNHSRKSVNVESLITDNFDIWSSSIEAKSAQGRGSRKKLNLYGVQKLRELILELAVRGLLVPQDTSDEHASVLLDKIFNEKDRLIKEKKIKKPAALSGIKNEEKLFKVPASWAWTRMGDMVDIIRGITFPGSEKTSTPELGRLACLRTTNVQDKIEWEDLLYIREQFVKRKEQIVQAKDVVMSMANSRELVGKVAIIEAEPEFKTTFGGFLGVLRPRMIDPFYLMVLLRTPLNRNSLIDSSSQTTNIANVSLSKLNPLVLAIPPLAEQHRIVAKVDELMALCDQLEQQTKSSISAHQALVQTLLETLINTSEREGSNQAWARIAEHFDTLFTTEWSIDQLKQTILQLAVMGKLVPQNPNDEPASELLKKIAAEKARLIKEGKIKKQKSLPQIDEDEKPFELPLGWQWVNLRPLITVMDAGWSPACPPTSSPDNDTWGVLKTTAVQSMEYREFENKVLSSSKEPRSQYEVQVGDILITRAGPKNRVGVSCLVQSTRPKLMISDKIIRFHLVEVGMCERFISLCLNAGATAEFLEAAKSGMAESQMNISQDKLKAAPIPLCPINEQHRIVAKVDELMALCDTLKTHINTAHTTQLHLADAMAEQAIAC